jgi:hypothetical protein
MTTEYPVKMTVTLQPVKCPLVTVTAGKITHTQQLLTTTSFDFDFVASDQAVLTVEHHGKLDLDVDTAVIVQSIEFYGICDPRFIWAGIYNPVYPGHYPDQKSKLPGQGYLGWNGTYVLEFQVPIFSWIHQVQDLGWLYQ